MPWNAVKQGMEDLGPDESWNMLDNKVNRVAPMVKKRAKSVLEQTVPNLGSGGGGQDPRDIWLKLDPAARTRFGGTFQRWIDAYNRGDYDGNPHNWMYDPVTGTLSQGGM